jgi:hypothetical protein
MLISLDNRLATTFLPNPVMTTLNEINLLRYHSFKLRFMHNFQAAYT